jgi:V/A-type H+-transporting ATPase subunit C
MASNYEYINARLRGQHPWLQRAKDYEELMALPDLEALARWFEASQYSRDWQLAKVRHTGLEAVEAALESHFGAVTAKLLAIAEGGAKRFIKLLLRRWDLANIKAVARGIHQGWGSDEIERSLWPAGSFGTARLRELAQQQDLRGLADTLATWGDDLSAPLVQSLPGYQEGRDIARVETALERHYYREALGQLRGPGHNPGVLSTILRREVDLANARAVRRLFDRGDLAGLDPGDFFIKGGQWLDAKTYDALFDHRTKRRTLASLKSAPFYKLLTQAEPGWQEEAALERGLAAETAQLYRQDPLAIDVVIGFLWQKFYEVVNLRLLARAKVFGLPTEQLRAELFLFVP